MLKNYKSSSPLPNIFNDIEKTLSTHGAKQIIRDYDGSGRINSISFVIDTARGVMGVKLPARFDKVEQIFKRDGYRYKEDQPYRTAWATIRDWIADQMALVDWEMVKPEEVFLPYGITKSGETIFEAYESGTLQLGSGAQEGEIIP